MQAVLEYADILIAVAVTLGLAWGADLLTGRRGFFATSLVSATGAACGWFLAVRVFGASTMDEAGWVLWSAIGSALCLVAFFLFRNKR